MLLDPQHLGARPPDRRACCRVCRTAREHRHRRDPRLGARDPDRRPRAASPTAIDELGGAAGRSSSETLRRRSSCGPPAPEPTRSRSGRRSPSPPASATSSSTARCASSPAASRPSPCTSTSASPTPRPRSAPPTGCASSCPLLLALSANSPFWQGRDTGLASARTPLFQAFPRVGIPRAFADYADYVEAVDAADPHATRSPSRPSSGGTCGPQPRFGTVEVRIMDAQTTVGETAALVALVQCLVRARGRGRTLIDEPIPPGGARREPLPRRPRRDGRRADRFRAGPAGAGARAARRACST